MYKKIQTKTVISNQPPMKSKRMHLISDDGFVRRLTLNLLAISFIIAVCTTNQTAHDFSLDIYYNMKECMMQIANEMAWWSILGLLSSSCCAIQILLNALSFGCAGFNNVLGPVRPTFVALTIVAQMSSWYVAYSYSTRPYQWRFTGVSSLLSVVITLLPEALAWQTAKRERLRQQTQITANTSTVCGTSITLQFQLSTMGCSSCVSTVSKVLDCIDGAIRHTVSLESGIAEIVLDNEALCHKQQENIGCSAEVTSMHDILWNDIAGRMQAVGFPVDIYDAKKEQ